VSENFVIVPANQPLVNVKLNRYAEFSDKGPFPIPVNMPVEGWGLGAQTIEQAQRAEGQHTAVVVDPYHQRLYEFYDIRRMDSGWEAATAVIFDLTSNALRHKDWPSANSSGTPNFAGQIRYGEVAAGSIKHAIGVTVEKTRWESIYPATHSGSGKTGDRNYPAMGQRFRLKANVDISKFSPQALPVTAALKKYGAIVVSHGRAWDLIGTADKRLDMEQLRALYKLKGSDFEVIQTTGEHEGPRSTGK
jgi:hypothetical protein